MFGLGLQDHSVAALVSACVCLLVRLTRLTRGATKNGRSGYIRERRGPSASTGLAGVAAICTSEATANLRVYLSLSPMIPTIARDFRGAGLVSEIANITLSALHHRHRIVDMSRRKSLQRINA